MRIKRLVIGIFNMASSLNLKTHYNAIPISYNQNIVNKIWDLVYTLNPD